jgi:LysM repeat protein
MIVADSGHAATDASRKGPSTAICFTSDPKKPDSPTAAYYTVTKGGTLQDIAKKTGIPLSSLCQLNGLSRNAKLKHGQAIKLTQANLPIKPAFGSAACAPAGKAAVKDSKKTSRPDSAKASRKASGSSAQAKPAAREKVKSASDKKSAKPAATASAKKPGRQKDADKAKKSVPATAKNKSTEPQSASAKSADRTRLARK